VIFVDTGFFFALLSGDDPDHGPALEVFETFGGRRLPEVLLTTNHVVFEAITSPA
jgi:predicted nucleic acid-binding protein